MRIPHSPPAGLTPDLLCASRNMTRSSISGLLTAVWLLAILALPMGLTGQSARRVPAIAKPQVQPLAPGDWIWWDGSSTVGTACVSTYPCGQVGVYGTEGTVAPGNIPGSRSDAMSWTDTSGRKWLFGGFGYGANGALGEQNDLWQANALGNAWGWISGSNGPGHSGVYGTMGTPAALNVPGGREGAATWTDKSGNLWLFGGLGYDGSGTNTYGYENDLWMYNPNTNQWTWESGSSTVPATTTTIYGTFIGASSGVYGTLGTPASGNTPSGRTNPTAWTDSSGNLWLLGGGVVDEEGFEDVYNDLWEFNTTTKQWVWMGGGNTLDELGVYGTLGTAASGNAPGARYLANGWTDNSGDFWLFGGSGYASNAGEYNLNDLWKFSPTSNEWTWMGGASILYPCNFLFSTPCPVPGTYGTLGTAASTNFPGGRNASTTWTDSSGNLWLFGGAGQDANNYGAWLNDLWEYNPGTTYWTWMGGSSTVPATCVSGGTGNCGQPGVYGSLGSAASTNVPGARQTAVAWTDQSGDFWLFGGWGVDENGAVGYLNDMWEYQPAGAATTPQAATPAFSLAIGTYPTTQSVTITDSTPNPTIYYTTNNTTPTTNSAVYNGTAITVSSTETIQAIATASGYTQSAVASATYTIGLPAVTLSQTSALTFVSSAGTTSAPQTFTVTNSGTANLSITGITIAGGNSNVFAQTNNCPSTLAPSALCTVSVTYTPTGEENDASYVSIADNAVSSPQTLEVLGLGSAAAGPGLTISPAGQLRFSALAGATSATQIITIASTGNVNLSINSVSIIGANPVDFAQTNNCGNSIAATGLCQISVTFTPAAAQTYSASVSIADNAAGSPQSVSLSGTGSATPLATQTQLSSSVNSVTLGTSVNLTAQVSETAGNSIPSGTVTFYDGTTSLGTALLFGNGTAPFITNALAVGTHSITATYGGDINNAGSTSAAVVVTVNAAAAGSGEWIWTGGNQGTVFGFIFEGPPISANAPVYGTQGTPSTANLPGNRYGAATWTDANGNLWLFGGYGYDSTGVSGYLSDLWEYSTAAKTWTWVGGSNVVGANDSQFGVYGTLGTAAPGNMPGGREYAAAWADNSGRLWLFGGFGSGAGPNASDSGPLNDLWMYNPSTNLWTWEGGSNNPSGVAYTDVSGVYGTQGTPSTSNIPGARLNASFAVDSRGNFWLFGGFGGDSAGNEAELNDLWMFNPSTGAWTWVNGSSVVPAAATNPGSGTAGVYGTKGTASSGSVPGSRQASAAWMDLSGNLWLFGGAGEDSIGRSGELSDLWMFNAVNSEWTWVGGSNTVPVSAGNGGNPGVYGTEGSVSATNMPGSRYIASAWTDIQGNLWLFGGEGIDSAGNLGPLNDLWTYSPSANEWTWMDGSNLASQYGSYGTLGVASPSNTPGDRNSAAAWTDKSGNFWLYGGDAPGAGDSIVFYYSDLWEYQSSAVTVMPAAATPTFNVPGGNYSSTQTVTISDTTPNSTIYYTTNGTAPNTNSAVYSGAAITVSATETIEAIATASGFTQSAVALATYTITAVVKTTPTVTVSPSPASITTAQGLTVTVTVSGTPTPTGSVVLSGGGYTSAAAALSGGTVTINIPAGSLGKGTDTLTATYTPDAASSSAYDSAAGTNTETVTAAATTPTVTVTPSPASVTTAQGVSVTVTVSGTPTPTGSVTLTSGSYTSPATSLSSGSVTINVPAGSLAKGTDTITATYTPNGASSAVYNSAVGTNTETVTAVATTPTVTVTPSPASVTTAQGVSVTVTVSGTPTPTGSIVLSGGGFTSAAIALNGGTAPINIPAGSLVVGTDTLTATYTPDSASSSTYNSASGSNTVTVATPAKTTPTVTVTPSPASVTTAQGVSVTVTVSGTPTPTGSIVLSGGGFTSAAITLNGGTAPVNIPAGSLAAGADTLTATYTPDSASSSTYNSATGSNSVTVTATITAVAPTVTVTPASSSITTAQSLSVAISLGGGQCAAVRRKLVGESVHPEACGDGITPTGSVVLSGGGYTSAAVTLSSDSATIVIPAGALTAGADTLTATYTPDSNSSSIYTSATGTYTVTVTEAVVTAPVASLTPPSLTFASLSGTTTAAQTATLSNSGNAALAITGIAITGANAADFAQTNTCGNSLAAGANCIISVTFTPASAASFSATLSVTDNAAGSPQTVTLSGTGSAPPSFTLASGLPSGSGSQTTAVTYTITVTPQNGSFTSPITFAASGLPSGYIATFSPQTVTPGSSPASTTLTIKNSPITLTETLPLATPALAFLGFCFVPFKRRRRLIAMCLLTVASLGAIATLSGCGGGFALLKPAQTDTVTITASGGGQTQTTTVMLTIQE